MHNEADETWEQIRATRANPPAPARSTPERRRTYGTALEQAQQLFRAAAAVAPEAQPLLVFYGLSQAGRAIAAASASTIAEDDGWQLQGHGIYARCLDGPLTGIQVRSDSPGDRGSFVRLSEILGSPLLPKSAGVRLEDLWDCVPENQKRPLGLGGKSRRTPMYVEARHITDAVNLRYELEPSRLLSIDVCDFPPWVGNSPQPRKALDEYLNAFPDVPQYHNYVRTHGEPDAPPKFHRDLAGWFSLTMNWALPDGATGTVGDRFAVLDRFVRSYQGSTYVFPGVAGSDQGVHPLMAWWAVLHALSMLARYQPDQWVRHIDVDEDGSRAVAIERLLREALTAVPQLIAETIEDVAKPSA